MFVVGVALGVYAAFRYMKWIERSIRIAAIQMCRDPECQRIHYVYTTEEHRGHFNYFLTMTPELAVKLRAMLEIEANGKPGSCPLVFLPFAETVKKAVHIIREEDDHQ